MSHALYLAAALLASAPASLPVPPAPAVERVFAVLHRAERPVCVRFARQLPRGDSLERELPRGEGALDASWLLRFERFCAELPAAPCRRIPLVSGQSYKYGVRVQAAGSRADAVELDFRGACARFVAGDTLLATANFAGRERSLVGLLLRALPKDAALAQLARVFEPVPATDSLHAVDEAESTRPGTLMNRAADVDDLAVVEKRVDPEYPDIARDAQVEGRVVLLVRVRMDGTVGAVRVTKSIPMLDDAAVAAVKQWRWRPAQRDGKPVGVWAEVEVPFVLP